MTKSRDLPPTHRPPGLRAQFSHTDGTGLTARVLRSLGLTEPPIWAPGYSAGALGSPGPVEYLSGGTRVITRDFA